jgi:hypothetical protein
MPVLEWQGAMASLKAASELAQSMLKLEVKAEVQTKVIELQQLILAAQASAMDAREAQQALQERVRLLEEQLRDATAWRDESARYELVEAGKEAFFYVLKSEAAQAEPSHYLCPNCFHDSRKSILQLFGTGGDTKTYDCPRCKSRYYTNGYPRAQSWGSVSVPRKRY